MYGHRLAETRRKRGPRCRFPRRRLLHEAASLDIKLLGTTSEDAPWSTPIYRDAEAEIRSEIFVYLGLAK